MTEYHYVRIGSELVDKLSDELSHGGSLVLLGPRNVGKRYVLQKLDKLLAADGRGPVGQLSLLPRGPHHKILRRSARSRSCELESETGALSWLDKELATRPAEAVVTLFIANADFLPQERLRIFLNDIKNRINCQQTAQDQRVNVVLTGEVDLSRFLASGLSAFTCARQYVLAHFERDLFDTFARGYLSLLGACVKTVDDDGLARLFKRTGGRTYFLRLILWALFDLHSGRGGRASGRRIALSALHDEDVAAQMRWTSHLRYVNELLEGDPDCWSDLERLVAGKETLVPPDHPHLLELSGIAVRDKGKLTFPGSLIKEFVTRHYTKRRLADHYARTGDWPQAFERYQQLDVPERVRPVGSDDIADAGDVVMSLRTSFYTQAIGGPGEVLRRFREGCLHMLGFGEVTLWRYGQPQNPAGGELRWRPVTRDGFSSPLLDESCYLALLPGGHEPREKPGWIEVDESERCSVVMARLPTVHPDVQDVILAGKPGESSILSRARAALARQLVGDFVAAYDHAINVRRNDERLMRRDWLAQIVTEIVKSLGGGVRNVKQALEQAAKGLRELEYDRVIFSVIDPTRARIEAVVEDSTDPERRASQDTSYSLENNTRAGQVWVVKQHATLRGYDASTDERIDNNAAREVKARGIAIVPLLDPADRVIGTVSIERCDKMVPTTEETEDLEQFGRQLAGALISCEHIDVLHSALDTKSAPIAVFEQTLEGCARLRYANSHAGQTAGESIWSPPGKGRTLAELRDEPGYGLWVTVLEPLIRDAMHDGKERHETLELAGPSVPTVGPSTSNVVADVLPFWDWRGQLNRLDQPERVAGVVCHMRDETYLHRVFQAIRGIIAAHSIDNLTKKLLAAVALLGHRYGRLYRVDNLVGPTELISVSSFGIEDNTTRDRFDSGEIRLGLLKGSEHWETWLCIEKRQPILFCHDPELEDGTNFETPRGVQGVNSKSPACPPELRKSPKQSWIDFPLLAGDRVVGKLTLDWEAEKNPHDFELLKVLCALTSSWLEVWFRWDHSRQVAEEVYHDVVHSFKNHSEALKMALRRYRKLEKDAQISHSIRGLNDTLQVFCDQFDRAIDDARVHSLRGDIVTQRVDLIELIRESFGDNFDLSIDERKSANTDRIEMDLDRALMMQVLKELALNSRFHGRQNGAVNIQFAVKRLKKENLDWVRLIYTDNGPGVPDEMKARIFDRGVSSHGRPVRGLGLASVRRIINGHNGSIDETGKEGQGVRFVIDLPRVQVETG